MASEAREATYPLADEEGPDGAGGLPALPGGVLLERLFREGHLFDFFQAVWLLEQAFPEEPPPGETVDLGRERLRFRPHHGLAFPPTDIRGVDWVGGTVPRARLTVTFLGLYGVNSPLPVYFFEEIAAEAEEAAALRAFLDMFNHRIYSFYYRAWKKYRPVFQRAQAQTDLHARVFASLAGLGTPGLKRPAGMSLARLVAFAGRLADRVRNASGLRHLASEMLGGVPVVVEENVPRWVPIRERPRTGDKGRLATILGVTAIVGKSVRDLSGKFRVVVGPLGLDEFRSLLPGGPMAALLDYVVRLYAPDYLDYDVQLRLRTADVPPARLGGTQRMGFDMWLGHPAGEEISAIVAYR